MRKLSLIRSFAIAMFCIAGFAEAAEKPVEVVLSPYLNTTLRTMRARVGGSERSFLLDTGGGGTFLSKATADEMRLETYGQLTGFTHDGRRIDVPKAGPVDVSVGTFIRRGEVAVLDLTTILPGPSLGGILS
ncbi:MAG: aspartyl protease family protein, partial [Thermoanaerobaculia bacterium]